LVKRAYYEVPHEIFSTPVTSSLVVFFLASCSQTPSENRGIITINTMNKRIIIVMMIVVMVIVTSAWVTRDASHDSSTYSLSEVTAAVGR
jgi:hypothetical protein